MDSRCSGQEKGHVEARAKLSNVADLGTKHFTKERFEALRKIVDMEEIGRNSARYVGTITCDKNDALELAQTELSLMGVSTAAMGWYLDRHGCTNHHAEDDD